MREDTVGVREGVDEVRRFTRFLGSTVLYGFVRIREKVVEIISTIILDCDL